MKKWWIVLFSFYTGCATTKIPIDYNKISTSKDAYFQTTKNINSYSLTDLDNITVEPASRFVLQGEKQFWLKTKESAPFDGIIFNPEAVAYILTEYSALKERSDAALIKQKQSDLAKLNLETGKLQLKINSIYKNCNIFLTGKDEEIKRLQKINKDIENNKPGIWNYVLIGGGSVIVGTAIGIIIGSVITH